MNCKNCQDPLEKNALFCDNCGAKVITSRITFKLLIGQLFSDVFGVDSKFFLTLKKMLLAPEDVLNEYLTGVRKRYVNPFAFLAVGAALSLLTFNFFSDEFIKMQSGFETEQSRAMKALANKDLSTVKNISKEEFIRLQQKQHSAKIGLKVQEAYFKFFLQYFNLITFLILPLYALTSKWTYRKPHNYGEHIVMNAYLQGFTMYISLITFFISMYTSPLVYMSSMFLYFIYYLFAFGRLYNHSFIKSVVKFLKFLLVLGLVITLFTLVILIIGTILFFTLKWLNPELLKSIFTPN
ncbi:DUF3667 domain-containing protein [Polaribacter aquimarinus]|uniref:DUF3667 domain-containing protein n=1 Tax=Polaribacter aquimarinus TaxID=2100726 RepID=A0A2U2J746_9FLAO|nr:DUF3667 domain-containing protein [Polaribacter aquimarinus]PWG04163.1 hypothetical protein DIS07_14450 [Polaribacter aquimarinus]